MGRSVQIFFVVFFAVLSVNQLYAQRNYVDGTVSTTTSSSVQNLSVLIEYIDSTHVDTTQTLTDVSGYYQDTTKFGTYDSVRVTIPACVSTSTTIFKTKILVSNRATINFTNFCFSVFFTHQELEDSVYITAQVSGGVPPMSNYFFQFGDGNSLSVPFDSVHNYYINPGSYNVRLRVTDSNGDTASYQDSVRTRLSEPSFNYSVNGLQVNFTNTSSSFSSSPFYQWDFGDTQTSFQTNPLHTYNAAGMYNVCLTLTDTLIPSINTDCQQINLINQQCNANFTWQATKTVAEFNDQSAFTPPVQQVFYNWDFGDGVSKIGDTSEVHIFPGVGPYTVSLIIRDNLGSCVDTARQTIVLDSIPSNKIILGGRIDLNNTPRDAFVELIYGNASTPISVVDNMQTLKGHYAFYIDPNKTYYVLANPLSNDPLFEEIYPTYYKNAIRWSNATAISISQTSVLDADIDLINPSWMPGVSNVSGYVFYGNNNTPAQNIPVFTTDLNGMPANKVYTDVNGFYFINNAQEEILIAPEVPGRTVNPKYIRFPYAGSRIEDINFTIYDDKILGIDPAVHSEFKNIKIYPNPFINQIHVNYSGKAEIEILDALGRPVLHEEKGENQDFFSLDVSGLQNGSYVARISTREGVELINLMKIRK